MNNQIKKLTSKDTNKQFYRLIGHFKKALFPLQNLQTDYYLYVFLKILSLQLV